MKQLLVVIALFLSITGCDYIKNYNKPSLELTGQPPYTLNIRDFAWSYGTVTINQFNGDFDKLDEKIYDHLKGKLGTCKVFMQQQANDKYGNRDSSLTYIGDIDIDELNKYQSWKFWQLAAGTRTILYNYLQQKDSTKFVPNIPQVVPTPLNTVKPSSSRVNANNNGISLNEATYIFTIDDLYPTDEKPSTIESDRYVINGKIFEIKFDDGRIKLKVVTTDQELIIVQFKLFKLSDTTMDKLKMALKPNFVIKCVGTKVSVETYDLLAARITESYVAVSDTMKMQ